MAERRDSWGDGRRPHRVFPLVGMRRQNTQFQRHRQFGKTVGILITREPTRRLGGEGEICMVRKVGGLEPSPPPHLTHHSMHVF